MANTKPKFKSIAIYCHHKPAKEKAEAAFMRDMLRFFHAAGVKHIHGDVRTVSMLHNSVPLIDDEKSYDLKIGIGGDGTLLKMMRTLQKGDFNVDERMLIKAFVHRKNEQGKKQKVFRAYGLNEIVFGHGGQARLTNFNVKIDRRYLSTYRSDGVIFSTPTGSTAYSMSAGGPIMSPTLECISITPVAPHKLTHRPIVLPGDCLMHLNFDARVDAISMTIDGQIHFSLKSSDEITLQRATRTAKFIRLKKSHYFRTLRNKLGWGE